MSTSPALEALMAALHRLPGVGVKSATRMAHHLLQNDREGAHLMSQAIAQALDKVGHCERCHTLSELKVCGTCADPARDPTRLCVIETPADQLALERTGAYQGTYFVLMGRISPIEGLGPHQMGLQKLIDRACDGQVQEVILATNFTAEGEATAHVIGEVLKKRGLQVSRLSRGVPIGSELEFVDLGTIAHALLDRRST